MRLIAGGMIATVLYIALAWTVITLPATRATPLRFVVAVPFLLFLPGYAFLSMLFPGRQSHEGNTSPLSRSARFGNIRSIEQRGLTWGERAALSFGVSLIWLPILALLLIATPWGFGVAPMFVTVAVFIVLFSILGTIRRARLPPAERYVPPFRRWLIDARGAFSGSIADTLLTAILALSVLAAVASIGYAVAVPTDSSVSSEFFVGTTNASGQVIYDSYPDQFVEGQPVALTVGLENNEQRVVDYTVIAQFQQVEATDGNTTVLEREEAAQFTPTVPATAPNNTWTQPHEVTSPYTTENGSVRLVYLLYTGDPPANPTIENADYHVWVWPDGVENTATGNVSAAQNAPNATGTPNASQDPSVATGNATAPNASVPSTPTATATASPTTAPSLATDTGTATDTVVSNATTA
jgi:uncharacterized membrane protein